MKQLFTGPYSFDVATRTITLAGIEIPQERLTIVVNSTVGFVYHNLEHEPTAQVTISGGNTIIVFPHYKDKNCEAHRSTDKITIFYDDGVDLGQLIKDESDETQALLQAEFDETQTAITDFRTEVKAEFDDTQTLVGAEFDELQTLVSAFKAEVKGEFDDTQTLVGAEFDETQTILTDFKAEAKSESDATQAILQAEFDQTQTILSDFKAEVKAESDATQALLQTEFDETQTILSAFKAEAKSESDATQILLDAKLPGLIDGLEAVEGVAQFSPENGVEVNFVAGGYGPSQVIFSKNGSPLKTVNLTYDSHGNLVLIS